MSANDLEALRDHILSWQAKRVPLSENFTRDSLRGFAEAMNYHTRALCRLMESNDPEFYSALMELAQNATTVVTGAKLIVNKIDRTQL